ncbi:NosD domain-containing protein [Methanogenium organophilum]|uniref:PKD domain-containing protein n=1 Tax=Methanogenium organophilum TaxID=2199 RepID=A0A9X9S5I2_METOG|nr:NosD domain-containing protein [Methanogenium organophilum]WAI01828.1 PKD domain-containing protein [Methanogenium organophilum]
MSGAGTGGDAMMIDKGMVLFGIAVGIVFIGLVSSVSAGEPVAEALPYGVQTEPVPVDGSVVAGEAPGIEWARCLGGTGDEGEWERIVRQTADGGYIVTGFTGSNDGDVSGNHGDTDVWVVKLDAAGTVAWQTCLGGSSADWSGFIEQTGDGGYIVVGWTTSIDGDVSGNHGGTDIWVVKLNDAGAITWQRCFGGKASDRGCYVQQTPDGGYIVAGSTTSDDGDVSGNHGDQDILVLRLDGAGSLVWQRCLGGAGYDRGTSIRQTTDGGYIIAGETESDDGDVSGNHGGHAEDIWVAKLDDTGDVVWQKCLGGTDRDWNPVVMQTADGGYIVSGSTFSTDGDVTGNHGNDDAWIVKLDGAGTLEWQRCFGGSGLDLADSVRETPDGGYIMAGSTASWDGDVTGWHGDWDVWVIKLDNTGSPEWQRCLGGTYSDIGYFVQPTADGGYIVAAETFGSNDGDVCGNHGRWDAWIVKLSSPYGMYPVHNIDTGENFINIQGAIDDIDTRSGHVILVESGTYNENLVVTKQLVLQGQDTGEGYPVIDALCRDIGVDLRSYGIVFTHFTVKNAMQVGIQASSGSEISENEIIQNKQGIRFIGCSNVCIRDNYIGQSQTNGIEFYFSDNVEISENTIQDSNYYGIYGERADYLNLSGNSLCENGYCGVRLLFDAGQNHNTISCNNISRNVNCGLKIDGSVGNQIYLNNFIGNGRNAEITNADQNHWNTTELFCYPFGGINRTSRLGNYWSDYGGVDADGNGIGDTSYVVAASEQDLYPLVDGWERFCMQGMSDDPPRVLSAERSISAVSVPPGGETEVTVTFSGEFASPVVLTEEVPAGWTITPVSSTADDMSVSGASGQWIWNVTSPDAVTYRLGVPADEPVGTYTITGVLSDSGGDTVVSGMSMLSVVLRPTVPVANFTADMTHGKAPLAVNFTDMSTGSSTFWSWTFGDGTSSSEQNPRHVYTEDGTYTVTLAVNGCEEACIKVDYITVASLLPGDANGDGAVNQADTLRVLKEVVGMTPLPATNTAVFAQTDVHQNGVIDIGDAMFIAQFNVGLRDALFGLIE